LRTETGGLVYELAHEYLIQRITVDAQVQKRKQAEELIKQEVENWQRFGTLMAADKLDFVNVARDQLRLSGETQELLLRSALAHEHVSAIYWLKQVEDEEKRAQIVREYLVDSHIAVRVFTLDMLSSWDAPIVGEMLAGLLHTDTNPEVYTKAAIILVEKDSASFVNCIEPMLASSPDEQLRALDAIANIQKIGIQSPNLDRLNSSKLHKQLRHLHLRRNRIRRNTITLYTGLGGALAAVIGGLVGAILSNSRVELLPFWLTLSFMIGIAIGVGAGFGYGTIEAMEEHRSSIYVASAALGGGVGGMLVGIIGDTRLGYALLGATIGFFGGLTGGGGAALIIRLTESMVVPHQRLAIRIAAGLTTSVISGGVFALGTKIDVLPLEIQYGFGLGLLTLGILGGLEFHERRLRQANQSNKSNGYA